MHVEHLYLPKYLLGAQGTNALVPGMQSMLEDRRDTFCKEDIQSIFAILSALLTNCLMNLFKNNDVFLPHEYSLKGQCSQAQQLPAGKRHLCCHGFDLWARCSRNTYFGKMLLAQGSNRLFNHETCGNGITYFGASGWGGQVFHSSHDRCFEAVLVLSLMPKSCLRRYLSIELTKGVTLGEANHLGKDSTSGRWKGAAQPTVRSKQINTWAAYLFHWIW